MLFSLFQIIICQMFEQSLYESCNFNTLYNQKIIKSHLIQQAETILSQRSVLIHILHMLLGMPSDIFVLKSSSMGKQGSFEITLGKISMQHLSSGTLKNQLQRFCDYGNKIQTLKHEAKVIYSLNNYLLKHFSEGIFEIVNIFVIFVSSLLEILQQQSGNISRNQKQYELSQKNPMTLLSLERQIKKFEPLLNFIISTIHKIDINQKSTPEDLQKSLIFLLNIYYYECDQGYLSNSTGYINDIHILFKGLIKAYINICKEWLEMNPSLLLMKSKVGFFIDFEEAGCEQQERLFEIKKIIKKEYIPHLFNKNCNKIVQLGKTIQFIKLYFGPEEKDIFRQYMNFQQQFSILLEYINKLSKRELKEKQFFEIKPRKCSLISDKIKNIRRPQLKITTVPSDNPYKMYPQINGFINLRSNYVYTPKQQNKSRLSLMDIQKNSNEMQGNNINYEIKYIFDEILQRISNKCLHLLQKNKLRQSLEHTLRGIKKIMLFQQGDFIQEFLQLSKEILNKPSEKISRNNVQRLIEEAIRSSNLREEIDIIKENITFTFLKTEQGLKGWRIFSFIYKPQKPTNCIFTSKVIESYSYISNLLFNIRRCEQTIIQTWSKYLKEGMGIVLKARNAVHHYIKALLSYILLEIQNIWTQFLDSFNENGNILTIIQANQIILAKMRLITLENPPLLNCVLFIVKIVDRLQNIHTSIQNGNEQGIKKDLDQIWSWFLNILDQSKKITNFCDTFDFRSNYQA